MTNVLIGLGSNLGDRAYMIVNSIRELFLILEVEDFQVSDFYWSQPLGYQSSYDYLNACLYFKTDCSAEKVLESLLLVEQMMGRFRLSQESRYQDRLIDLDLLCFGHMRQKDLKLHLPHPKIAERDFVLLPLQDLNVDWQLFIFDQNWIESKLQTCAKCVYAKQINALI